MKHSWGITVGLHFRQPDYTRGQSIIGWLGSLQYGRLTPYPALHYVGGHESRSAWARITVVGVSLQINVDHCVSNWPRRPAGRAEG